MQWPLAALACSARCVKRSVKRRTRRPARPNRPGADEPLGERVLDAPGNGTPQRRAICRRSADRWPGADFRRCRKRKDARLDAPYRAPARRDARRAGSHPRRDVHQQSRRRDEDPRLHAMVGPVARDLWVGTFHAMCVRILAPRRRADRNRAAASPSSTTPTSANSLKRFSTISITTSVRLAAGACLAEIDKAKNALVWPEQYAREANVVLGERIANVYTEYQRRLAESNSLDFDDLIVRTIDLLERDKATRDKYQQRFEYVLVDEYQDVNAAQYRLVATACGLSRQRDRGRRRRSVDLLLARQRLPHDLAFRRRFPRRQDVQARGKLPEHQPDSRRGEYARRQ